MKVVYVYGPPGVGKLTVATELAALTGFKLFHNHLSVNLVTAVFPRESGAWITLLRHIRRDVFTAAAREGVDLIYTGAFVGSADQTEAIKVMLEPVRASGGTVLFVQLACDRDELVVRVQSESRRLHQKLTDPQVLLDRYDLTATLPFAPHLRLDTTHLPPLAAASRIAAHYALPIPKAPSL